MNMQDIAKYQAMTILTIEHRVGAVLLNYIDRLEDQTETDTAAKIVEEMLVEIRPMLDEYFQRRFSALGGGYSGPEKGEDHGRS